MEARLGGFVDFWPVSRMEKLPGMEKPVTPSVKWVDHSSGVLPVQGPWAVGDRAVPAIYPQQNLQASIRIQYYELDPTNFITPRSHLDAQTIFSDFAFK